ncbi:creatininase [Ignicoccus pacificus DSM 13166]|uniref:Creatininase n=1 Tax=Ignicoccus pacificus DSM 13166 TaxID=940294 RepID=A0A977PKU4_9CREN|nr:creatininase [Ignicoccus pacificus DSM 13166]
MRALASLFKDTFKATMGSSLCKLLADAAAKEAKNAKAILVPVGSLEDHGPLPMGLDTKIAERVACSIPGVYVAPSINYSFSPEHAKSITMPLEILVRHMSSLAEQLYQLSGKPVLFVVAHKGAVPPLQAVVMEIFRKGVKAAVIDLWKAVEEAGYKDFQDLCRAEASVALALGYSVVVRKTKAVKSPPALEGATIPWISTEYGCSPKSVSEARKEEGEKIIETMINAVRKVVEFFESADGG